jgi:hypothetical protein
LIGIDPNEGENTALYQCKGMTIPVKTQIMQLIDIDKTMAKDALDAG